MTTLKIEKTYAEYEAIKILRKKGLTIELGTLRKLARDGKLPFQLIGIKTFKYKLDDIVRSVTEERERRAREIVKGSKHAPICKD